MTDSYPDALALSRKVLPVVVGLNLLFGAGILALLVASVVAETPVMVALGTGTREANPELIMGMRLIALVGVGAVAIVHFILKRLVAIVETVSAGAPFVKANAARLGAVAWAVLALEVTHVMIGGIASAVSTSAVPLDIRWSLSPTRWVAVLLLFVLARVFEQGTRMSEEVEGLV